eukprot:762934-Hanusia_phi.AAC.4
MRTIRGSSARSRVTPSCMGSSLRSKITRPRPGSASWRSGLCPSLSGPDLSPPLSEHVPPANLHLPRRQQQRKSRKPGCSRAPREGEGPFPPSALLNVVFEQLISDSNLELCVRMCAAEGVSEILSANPRNVACIHKVNGLSHLLKGYLVSSSQSQQATEHSQQENGDVEKFENVVLELLAFAAVLIGEYETSVLEDMLRSAACTPNIPMLSRVKLLGAARDLVMDRRCRKQSCANLRGVVGDLIAWGQEALRDTMRAQEKGAGETGGARGKEGGWAEEEA